MGNPSETIAGEIHLLALRDILIRNKAFADSAIAQLSDEQLRVSLHPETNSVAIVMKHVAGNLRSRWTDFLTTDGEKSTRGRDNEFVDTYTDRATILADWENGWQVMLDSIAALEPSDLLRVVAIRGEKMSVPHAIYRSITHCSYHIGQIVQTARILADDQWQTLTIPRGQSEEFNRDRWSRG